MKRRIQVAIGTAGLALSPVCAAVLMLLASLSAQGEDYKVLYSFTALANGANPFANLISDAAGNVYGNTAFGGDLSGCYSFGSSAGCGVVFKLDATGTETILHTFAGADGSEPLSGLIRDSAGNLFGTTLFGGSSQFGNVFEISPTAVETVLYSFGAAGTDALWPQASLVRDAAGNLYGTTTAAAYGAGTVFKLDSSAKETDLYKFSGEKDGGDPVAGLIRDADGNLYGTAFSGGDFGYGVVFMVDLASNETVLHNFAGGADGLEPMGTLVRDKDGNLYGTTYEGGAHKVGIVFKLDVMGNETVLHAFSGGADGANPVAGLVMDEDSNLYGTTTLGGVNGACPSLDGCGTVFRVDSDGHERVLHRFTGKGGAYPQASLILEGRELYGTTYAGGPCDGGVVFRITPDREHEDESADVSASGAEEEAATACSESSTAESSTASAALIRGPAARWQRTSNGLYRISNSTGARAIGTGGSK